MWCSIKPKDRACALTETRENKLAEFSPSSSSSSSSPSASLSQMCSVFHSVNLSLFATGIVDATRTCHLFFTNHDYAYERHFSCRNGCIIPKYDLRACTLDSKNFIDVNPDFLSCGGQPGLSHSESV